MLHLHLIKAVLTLPHMLELLISPLFLLFATVSASLPNLGLDLLICTFPHAFFIHWPLVTAFLSVHLGWFEASGLTPGS